MQTFHISSFNDSHIDDAIQLIKPSYEQEKEHISILPSFGDYTEKLRKSLNYLAINGVGISILKDSKLVAYMVGYQIDEFFGKEKGIFVPTFGHATKDQKEDLEILLYQEVSQVWVKQSILTHAISIFAHDQQLLDTYHDLGFGNRCADVIKKINILDKPIHSYQFKEINKDNASLLVDLHREHNLYYKKSPMFMPREDEDALKDLEDWLSEKDHRLFGLFDQQQSLGYIRFQNQGESLFSIHPSIKNISSLYVSTKYRQKGMGKILLDEVEYLLNKENINLLGVDFETINPKGYRFWKKHFDLYSYSLVRRIDERIIL